MLITERNSGHLLLWEAGDTRRVGFPSGRIWVSGETGLMSMEVDPNFADNGRFYTCSGLEEDGRRPRHPGDRLAAQRRRDPSEPE